MILLAQFIMLNIRQHCPFHGISTLRSLTIGLASRVTPLTIDLASRVTPICALTQSLSHGLYCHHLS